MTADSFDILYLYIKCRKLLVIVKCEMFFVESGTTFVVGLVQKVHCKSANDFFLQILL